MGILSRLFGGGEPPKPDVELPFEHELVRGKDALARLEALRREGREKGFSAVMLGDAREASGVVQDIEDTTESILAEAKRLDASTALSKCRRTLVGDNGDVDALFDQDIEANRGSWPALVSPLRSLGSHCVGLAQRPAPWVVLARIPTRSSYEIPAYLKIGGWNEFPWAADFVPICRSWQERYGAELIAATKDVVEFAVDRPPDTRDEAERLAIEHYVVCPDRISQGEGTLSRLAATLLHAPVWYFWWD